MLSYQDKLSKIISTRYTYKANKKIWKGFSFEVGIEIASGNINFVLVIDSPLGVL